MTLWTAHARSVVSIDLHNKLYVGAKDVLHGRNPFPPPDTVPVSTADAIWPACTKRYPAALLAAGVGAASLLLILPFDSISNYAGLVRSVSRTFDDDSYTLYGLPIEPGSPSTIARAVSPVVGAAILALAWHRRSFALAICAALLLSPIVWLHCFALLIVALAIVCPTLRAAWLISLPMWFASGTLNGRPWENAIVLASFAAIIIAWFRSERPRGCRRRLETAEAG